MEKQQLIDIARESLDAFNQRDWNKFRDLLAPNAVYDEVGTGVKVTGKDEIVDVSRGWPKAFSDLKGTIEHSIASDDHVLCAVTYEGTHDGELKGPTGPVRPSGRRVTTRCLQMFRVSNGHVVEMRNYFDMLHILSAVNALPTQAAKRAGA